MNKSEAIEVRSGIGGTKGKFELRAASNAGREQDLRERGKDFVRDTLELVD